MPKTANLNLQNIIKSNHDNQGSINEVQNLYELDLIDPQVYARWMDMLGARDKICDKDLLKVFKNNLYGFEYNPPTLR